MSRPSQPLSNWARYLRKAFGLIAFGIALAGIVSLYVIHHTQRQVESIESRSVASITLVFRLSRDIQVRRRLVDAHIVATRLNDMERIEMQLGGVDARIIAISRDYEPTINDDAERDLWQQLQTEIATVRPDTEKVLALSRKNLNTQARKEMETLEPQFDVIDRTIDDLVRMNNAGATRELRSLRTLRTIVAIGLVSLVACLIILVLVVARWATRLIKNRETQLHKTNSELEERNRELNAFAGRVAHDLRGPLTAISLAVPAPDPVSGQTANAVFRRSVKRMEAIIQDLLTLSRIGAHTLRGTCEAVAAVASIEEDLRPKVEELGGVLGVKAAAGTISCNEGLLRQVLSNLGENSVKYRRSGVQLSLEIRGRVLSHTYELLVSDNGMGMSPSVARRAFDPFFRGRQGETTPGSGLGLSIVKRVVEASGGSISIESVVDVGTTFRVLLPLADDKVA